MATYFLTNDNSDLSGGADYDKIFSPNVGVSSSITVSVTNEGIDISFFYTDTGVVSSNDWDTGVITVEVNITTASNNIFLNLSASRLDLDGAVLETSDSAGEQAMDPTGVKNFTIPSKDWSSGNCSDRLRLNFAWRSIKAHGSEAAVTFETNTTDSETVTVIVIDTVCLLQVNVDDSISITNVPTVSIEEGVGDLSINVNDTQAITENITIDNQLSAGINVNNSISLSEDITVSFDQPNLEINRGFHASPQIITP